MSLLKLFIPLCSFILLTSCAIKVPSSQIPSSAWKPGDIGIAKQTIYIDKDGSDLSLGTNPNYNHIGTLEPGERIRITRCYRYPITTTGGTHLDAIILDGELSGTEVYMSILGNKYDFIYLMPNPEVMARAE